MTKILTYKSDVDLDYPICRPSLDLDFTQEELDPRITFTRGSIGTRVNRNRLIETVAANQPRFDYDPVTGECKGLLIEESRSNLFTYSDDAQTAWSIKSGLTVSSNVDVSPDGNTTADALVEDTLRNDKYLERQITVSANQNITWSCFVKPSRRTNIFVVIYDGASYSNNISLRYEYSNKTVSFAGAFGTGTLGNYGVIDVGNGWYRMYVSGQPTTSASSSVRIRIGFVNQSSTYTGTGVLAGYVWGAQLEVGAFPTSYIPTTASTVTRSADLVSMEGTNFSSWYNQSEGTIYVNNKIPYTPSAVFLYFLIFGINAGNRHSIEQTTANGLTYITQNSGGIQYWSTSGSGILPVNTNRKTTYAYSSSNSKTLLSGTSNQTYTFSVKSSVDVYKSMTTMYIGRFSDSLFFLNGTISRLTYYPRALKPNQLQLLTQ